MFILSIPSIFSILSFISGRRYTAIKTYIDRSIKCKKCGASSQKITVYQEYSHFLWIPFIPMSKEIECQCVECWDESNREKSAYYRSITRTPFYMYTGIFLLGLIFLKSFFIIYQQEKQDQESLFLPQARDVYKITTSEYSKKKTVCVAKVRAIQ